MYFNRITYNKFYKSLNNVQKSTTNIKKYEKTGKILKIQDNKVILDDIKNGNILFNTSPTVFKSNQILILYYKFVFNHNFFVKNWNDLDLNDKKFVTDLKEDMDNMHVKLIVTGILATYLFFVTKWQASHMLVDKGKDIIEYKNIPVNDNLTSCEVIKKGEETKLKGNFENFNQNTKNKIFKNYYLKYNYTNEQELKLDIIKNGTYQEINNDDFTLND